MDMNNSVVLITGAGSGLGRALAKAFSSRGAHVVGLGRNEENLQNLQQDLGSHVFDYHVVDISNYALVKTVFSEILGKHNKIDIIFNNAAVYPKINFLSEDIDDFAQAISTNVNAVANICKLALPGMLQNKQGKIFNVGSWADLNPIKDSAAYSASKGALHALTKGIAVDTLRPDINIAVHEWIPGHLNTQMSDFTGIDPSLAAKWGVEIALAPFDGQNNKLYVENRIWQAPVGLKEKIKKRLFFLK